MYREKISSYELTLQLMTNAIYTLNNLVFGLKELEAVEIYLYEPKVVSAFNRGWIDNWKAHDWKNAKGKDIEFKDTWVMLLDYVDKSAKRFIITDHYFSSASWLEMKCQQKIETERRIRALKKMEERYV